VNPSAIEPPDGTLDEAIGLIQALVDAQLPPDEATRLDELVRAHPAVCRLYLHYIQLHRTLPRFIAPHELIQQAGDLNAAMILPALVEPTADPEAAAADGSVAPPVQAIPPTPATAASPARRDVRVRWAAAILLPLMVAIGVLVGRASRTSPRPSGAVAERSAGATVSAAVRADLRQADGQALGVGSAAPSGTLVLRSGWVRLDFDQGAAAVVEAPATFRVVSATELAVTAGRMSAEVPPAAYGFAVSTPVGRVVDLGTEFGVAVASGGATDVLVFRGSVSFGHASGTPQVLTRGQGRHLASGDGPPVATAVAPDGFVRLEQFDRWTAAATDIAPPAERARAADEQMCRDPALALYYRFADGPADDGLLLNRASSTAGHYNLTLAGRTTPKWVDGRLPGSASLGFDPAGQQRLLLPAYPASKTGSLSCAAWVYCNARSNWASIAKNWGDSRYGAFHLGLFSSDGDLSVGIQVDRPAKGVVVREGAGHPFPLGRWVHVAFTTDASTLRLYRDGEQVASAPSRPITATPDLHSLAIGFKTDDSGTNPSSAIAVGFWDGRMGDLALFHRALSADEVRRMYEAGRP
jgi:hypothetical protein